MTNALVLDIVMQWTMNMFSFCVYEESIVKSTIADFHSFTTFVNKNTQYVTLYHWGLILQVHNVHYPIKSKVMNRKHRSNILKWWFIKHGCLFHKSNLCILWPHCKIVMSFIESNKYCTKNEQLSWETI
jgi:hypothetical protein